jgi:hypothetical protein
VATGVAKHAVWSVFPVIRRGEAPQAWPEQQERLTVGSLQDGFRG